MARFEWGSTPYEQFFDPPNGISTLVVAPGAGKQYWITDISFYATISGAIDYDAAGLINNGTDDKYAVWHGLSASLQAPIRMGENNPIRIGVVGDVNGVFYVNIGYYIESTNSI